MVKKYDGGESGGKDWQKVFLKSKLRSEWVQLIVFICYQMEILDYSITMQRTTKGINKYSYPTAERKESWLRPC